MNRLTFTYLVLVLLVVSVLPFRAPVAAPLPVIVAALAEEGMGGPDEALLRAVAETLGTRIQLLEAPFQRRLVMMKSGHIDLMTGLLRHPERESFIHFVAPPYKTRSDTIFFVPRGKARTIQSYEDLRGKTIGVVRGLKYFQRFDRDKTLTTECVDQTVANFKKLILGRLDAVIQAEAHGIDVMNKMGLAGQMEIAEFRFSRPKAVYLGISKASGLMGDIERVEPLIRRMIESGQSRQIYTDYYNARCLPVPAM